MILVALPFPKRKGRWGAKHSPASCIKVPFLLLMTLVRNFQQAPETAATTRELVDNSLDKGFDSASELDGRSLTQCIEDANAV